MISALLVAACIVTASYVAFRQIRTSQADHVSSLVGTYARIASTKLQERLSARFLVVELLGREMSNNSEFRAEEFTDTAINIHRQLSDLQALNWVGANGVIEIVTPEQGNEAALGLNVLKLETPSQTMRDALTSSSIRITPPITLAQGGRGFVAYLPVRRSGELAGYLNLVFKADTLVKNAIGVDARMFNVSISDGDDPVFGPPQDRIRSGFAATQTIDLGGRTWTFVTTPTDALLQTTKSSLGERVLLIGILLGLCFGVLIYQSAKSRHSLRDREERFALAMRGASDGLFDWNPQTGACYFSPRWLQMLGYCVNELPAHFETFTGLVHPDDLPNVLEETEDLFLRGDDYMEKEFRLRHKDGTWRWILSRACLLRNQRKVIRVVGTHVDTTERHERQRALEVAANTDDLTGLRNRRGLLDEMVRKAHAALPGEHLVVFHLDLDKFKSINDMYGHTAGDRVLRFVSRRLKEGSPSSSLIARVGGDEFLVSYNSSVGREELRLAAANLLSEVNGPILDDGGTRYVSASIGVAIADGTTPDDVEMAITNADMAQNAAKLRGKGQCAVYEEEIRSRAVHSAEISSEIESGLQRKEFYPHFQPQIDVLTGEVVGFEALARWAHPNRGVLTAGEFIPFANSSFLAEAIDCQIFEQACHTYANLFSREANGISLSVNISSSRLENEDLVDELLQTVRKFHITPQRISIEILETTLLSDGPSRIANNVLKLSEAGFQLELDDFGVGHTALSSLRNFPVSRIKIDSSLISNLVNQEDLQTIAKAIIKLANDLDIVVLAEGVEAESELDFLRRNGCQFAQGFHISTPLPREGLLDWLREWNSQKRTPASIAKAS